MIFYGSYEIYKRLPGGDGVVLYKKLTDGTLILVTQEYSSFGEPYQVSFYFKIPDQEWGWCYIDHQDVRWIGANIKVNSLNDQIEIWKGNTLRAIWDRRNNIYIRPNVHEWKTVAPQEYRDPPFLSLIPELN